jgi:tryptophanyl-tRNA synthetase
MALENWLQERARMAVTEASDVVRQFALETIAEAPTDNFTEIREGFAQVGVWAFQNPSPVFKALAHGKSFSVLVGMRPGATFHLGHLTLIRELHWLLQQGGQPIFVFAGYEADRFLSADDAKMEMTRFGEKYMKFTGNSLPVTSVSFSDQDCRELQVLENRAGECLSVRKVLQLYGWDESLSVARLRIPAVTAAAFLLPTMLFPKRLTLVLSDIHQITHAETAKIVARQLKLPLPSYSYRLLLPSLEGPEQRMSVKNSKSLILLDEAREQIERKLQRSFSGGRLTPEEQHREGGSPHRCSFFKIAEVLQLRDTTTRMYQECVSGTSLCGECKKKHMPTLVEKIHEASKL